jgi:hypothetical protein
MTTPKLFRSPVAHRSGAILAAAFLLLTTARAAGAAPSASGSSGSSAGATATRSASATTGTPASSDQATSRAAAACPDQVRITLGRMTVSGGMVTISFTHNAHGCPSARPALLHLHQNLLTTPRAGSDPVHQWNADLLIGPSHGDGVTVPLLESADGKCFVQVDAHASGDTRGQFFPTTTCSSASPSTSASSSTAPSTSASSSTAPSTSASTSTAPSTSASTSTAPSTPAPSSTAVTSTASTSSPAPSTTGQSVLPESTSRTAPTRTFFPVGQVEQSPPGDSLAETGSSVAAPVGLAAGLLIAGACLVALSRRPRRH